ESYSALPSHRRSGRHRCAHARACESRAEHSGWRERDPRDFRLSVARVQRTACETEPASRATQPPCPGTGARLLYSRCQGSRASPCCIEAALWWGGGLPSREIHPSRLRSFPYLVAPLLDYKKRSWHSGTSMTRVCGTTGHASAGCSKSRPARPQRVKARGVPLRYVEGLNDARTKLGGFFSILQIRFV